MDQIQPRWVARAPKRPQKKGAAIRRLPVPAPCLSQAVAGGLDELRLPHLSASARTTQDSKASDTA